MPNMRRRDLFRKDTEVNIKIGYIYDNEGSELMEDMIKMMKRCVDGKGTERVISRVLMLCIQ